MPSRRRLLEMGSFVTLGALSGCTLLTEQSIPVDVRFLNDDEKEWPVTVIVEREDTVVFRTEEQVPADDGTDLGRVMIEDAFEGTPSDQFEVRVLLDSDPVGTYDFSITCTDRDEPEVINIAIEHEADTASTTPVDFVAYGCQ